MIQFLNVGRLGCRAGKSSDEQELGRRSKKKDTV